MNQSRKTSSQKSVWKKVGPSLYRYRNGPYYALIKHHGKQIRRSLETTDLPHARRKLAEFKRDLEHIDPTLTRRTLESQAEKFLETVSGAKSTLYNIRHAMACLLKDWPSDSPRQLAKICKPDCERWLAKYAGLSASTINSRICYASRFFEMAVNEGVTAKNPMRGISYRRRGKPTRLTPTREQFLAIVADLRSMKANGHGADDSADFVELSGFLGLGQAELSSIQRQHIDLNAETIQVFRRKTKQCFTIPIYPEAKPVLERRMAGLPQDPTARLLSQNNCKKGLAAACKRLGFPNFEPRSLRRFFITSALRAGVDVATVAAWQGHQDGGALLLKTYGDTVKLEHSLKMARLLKPV
jgi:site-specific recombinase XerD